MQRFFGLISTVPCFVVNSHIKAAVDEPGLGLCADEDGIVVWAQPCKPL